MGAAVLMSLGAGTALAAGDQGRPVELPITAVTVYPQLAKVKRSGKIHVAEGLHGYALPRLPGAADVGSVRASVNVGRVVRVDTAWLASARVATDALEVLLRKAEALLDKVRAKDNEIGAHQRELALLQGFAPAPPVPEDKRPKEPVAMQAAAWVQVNERVSRRSAERRAAMLALNLERDGIERELNEVRTEIDRFNQQAQSGQRYEVTVFVEALAAGAAELSVEYLVPGAVWSPVYDVRMDPAKGRVALQMSAVVTQSTGEDWPGVRLSLATAQPQRALDLPELLTWTLGEKGEFVPVPHPEQPLPVPQILGGVTARGPVEDANVRAAHDQAAARLARVMNEVREGKDVRAEREARRPRPQSGRVATMPGPQVAAPPPAPPPPPAAAAPAEAPMLMMADEAMAAQGEGMEEDAESAGDGLMGGLAGAARNMEFAGKLAAKKARKGGKRAQVSLAEPQTLIPPGDAEGGRRPDAGRAPEFVYRCPARVIVAPAGEPVRVPMTAEEFDGDVFYEATPALVPVAYLTAKVRNSGVRPIIGGPANIFVGGTFTGEGRLETTGRGGLITLPLGADDNIRLKRKVVPATEMQGVIMGREVTTYTVTIEAGNYKNRRIRLKIADQVPLSHNSDIKIEWVRAQPRPLAPPDAKGNVAWELDLDAGATGKVEFVYVLTRPKDWRLWQR